MRTWAIASLGVLIAVLLGASGAQAGCVVGVSPGKALNLRAGPSTRYASLGGIPADSCGVRVSRQCRRNWCQVSFGRLSGWASMKFLDRDRVARAVAVPATTAEPLLAGTDWTFLGARKIDFRTDRDVIPVGPREGRFRALQLAVRDADVDVVDLHVVFANGAVDTVPVRTLLRAGQRSRILDLAGLDRIVREVRITYRPRPGARDRAEVQVFGLSVGAAARTKAVSPSPRPAVVAPPAASRAPVSMAWQLIDVRSVTFKTDYDTVSVQPAGARFRALQLLVTENDVFFEDLKVIYGNGRVDDIAIRQKIPAGGRTRVIDLKGQNRIIREVRIVYRSRPPLSEAGSVAVYGLRVLN